MVAPLDGATVGVGMPVAVYFTEPVHDRAAVERKLSARSSRRVQGSWYWLSNTQVHYRPRTFWPAHSSVTVDLRLAGVDAGGGTWGGPSRRINFRTGAAMVSTVDVDARSMTVRRDDVVLRRFPITAGKPGFITRNGIKVISEKHRIKIMNARTIGIRPGDKDYYRLRVPYALRVTNSGEFVHAAPWSVGSQGRDNVSHGCVGMGPANARWLYRLTLVGDVVKVIGSPRYLEPGNGWTDWNVDWETWRKGSALA